MKKTLCTITALCLFFTLFSQETVKVKPVEKNEIKLNLLMTLMSFPEISYEHVWGSNIGLGASVGFPVENNSTSFQILPYTRFYFGENATKSFFIEASLAFQSYKNYNYDNYSYNYSSTYHNDFDFGLGVSFGYKYVNSSGLIGELFFGLGRTFDRDDVYTRIGISIGKQF